MRPIPCDRAAAVAGPRPDAACAQPSRRGCGLGRRGILSSAATTLILSSSSSRSEAVRAESDPPQIRDDHSAQRMRGVRACSPGEKCVSTANYNRGPSQVGALPGEQFRHESTHNADTVFAHQYAVPWIVPERMALAEASEELAQAIQDLGGTVSGIQSAGRDGTDLELAARAPGWGEEMTFLLRNDGVVLYTIAGLSGFGGIRVPDPPGCFARGCISGPPQRRYVEALRDRLSWLPMETDEDKEWVQLLLH